MNNLKQARQQAGLTQAQMSELLEIPKRTIEDWDRGACKPPKYVEKLIIEKLSDIEKGKNNMNLHELPIEFMTKEEAAQWLDNDEYKKYPEPEHITLIDCVSAMESGYNEYEVRLMYDYWIRTKEQVDVPVLNFLYGCTDVRYDVHDECFVIDCESRGYGTFKFDVPRIIIEQATEKETVVSWFNTANKVYNFMRNNFDIRSGVQEFEKLIHPFISSNIPLETKPVLSVELYKKIKAYFKSKWIEDPEDKIWGDKLFEKIIDNLMTRYDILLDEGLFQECKSLFWKHRQNLEFFDE